MEGCPEELHCYEFGGFRLDAIRRVIVARADGRRLPIPPKAFDAALYFVQHPGQILSKDELLAALWPGLLVEENGLTQIISVLRAALGETRGENRYIVTVPRSGYCLVASVLRVATAADVSPTQDRTVAVMSFDNWSGLATDESLTAGIAESILHRLAGLAGIKLVAQTSSFAFRGQHVDAREVGRRLDSRYLIEGSLQRAGDRLRIKVHLIDTADGSQVWSLMFNVSAEDAFTVEDCVARRVVRALKQSLVAIPRAPAPSSTVKSYGESTLRR